MPNVKSEIVIMVLLSVTALALITLLEADYTAHQKTEWVHKLTEYGRVK